MIAGEDPFVGERIGFPRLAIFADGVEQHHAIVGEQTFARREELAVMRRADMFEHADRHDPVEPAGHRAIVDQFEPHLVGNAGVLGALAQARLGVGGGLLAIARTTGRARWVTQLERWRNPKNETGPIFWTGPVLASNRLWVASSEGIVQSVDVMTGEATLFTELNDSVSLPPVVANNTLYILDDGGRITAWR